MKVADLTVGRVGVGLRSWRTGTALLGLAVVWGGPAAPDVEAQLGWRGRVTTRVQYVEARTLVRDSVMVSETTGSGTRRFSGAIPVTCSSGASYCYFYRSGSVFTSYPSALDLDLNLFGFGIEGLRAYGSVRVRSDLGGDEFWPRADDNFDLLAGYLELNRAYGRVRIGRDYQVSGLGFYGYDGGSLLVRLPPGRIELEAYGGWGLERGVPEPVDSDEFATLGIFQPQERNYLFGFRGSARPIPELSLEAIYQREIPTNRTGIASERLGFEAGVYPSPDLSLLAHADYDLATGWWGKAGASLGWQAARQVYLEGRLFRYRPVFSLQTIWVAFSPVPYTGWGLATSVRPIPDLAVGLELERREYGDTEFESPFLVGGTQRDWRLNANARWRPGEYGGIDWDVEGSYGFDWGYGASLNSGHLRVGARPNGRLSFGVRFSAFQTLEEFRITEGRVWGLGGDARWRASAGTVWLSLDRYDHDRREDPAQTDWTQWRGALGFSYYIGSEPGRLP